MQPVPLSDATISFLQESVQNRRHMIRRLKSKIEEKESKTEKLAVKTARFFGSIYFLILNLYFFSLWIILDSGKLLAIPPFDPFPYPFLTTVLSIEAIILTIFVLVSHNRAEKLESVREEIDLQFDIITEEELTKVMQLVTLLAEKNGIDLSKDALLHEMLKPVDLERIEKTLEKQIES